MTCAAPASRQINCTPRPTNIPDTAPRSGPVERHRPAHHGEVRRAGKIFSAWHAHLASLVTDAGLTEHRSDALAALTIASAEGAVAVARAEQSLTTFELVATQVIGVAAAA